MKKKLFIRDLEKRKSASQLFVDPVRGHSRDTIMHSEGKTFSKPGHGHPAAKLNGHEKHTWKSTFQKHKPSSSEPTYTTQALGEEGSAPIDHPIAKYAAPDPTPVVARYAAPDPTPVIAKYAAPDPTPVVARYAAPDPGAGTVTTMALGEEGSSPKPIDDIRVMYGVIDAPIDPGKVTTAALGEEGSSAK